MKNKPLRVFILTLTFLSQITTYIRAGEEAEVSVYLTDGSVVRGTMIGPESVDHVEIQTGEGMVVTIHIEKIDRIEEYTHTETVKSERKRHGKIWIGTGIALVALGFIVRLEPELRGDGFGFPNSLFLAGAILGTSGLYLYLTGSDQKAEDMERSSLNDTEAYGRSEL